MRYSSLRLLVCISLVCLCPLIAVQANTYSSNYVGTIGLNTVPNARMARADALWAGGSFSDAGGRCPDTHTKYVGGHTRGTLIDNRVSFSLYQ